MRSLKTDQSEYPTSDHSYQENTDYDIVIEMLWLYMANTRLGCVDLYWVERKKCTLLISHRVESDCKHFTMTSPPLKLPFYDMGPVAKNNNVVLCPFTVECTTSA